MLRKKVTIAIPQLSDGGAERVVSIWANRLYNLSYDVSLLLFYRTSNEYNLNPNIPCVSITKDINEYDKISPISRIKKIRTQLKELSPDYVISFLPAMQVYIMIASLGLKMKRIDTLRVNPWKIEMRNPLYLKLWKLSYYTCDKIIVQARDQIPWFNKKLINKIDLVPNPLSSMYSKELRMEARPIVNFIAVGRLAPQKNYLMMIDGFSDAVKSHGNISLKIFGQGSDEYVKFLQSYIREKGMENHIYLMGRTENIEAEYQKSDCFLMTSDYEGLPNALIEAMASQLVCISTDCQTGPRDLIDHGRNGFLVPVGGTSQLSSAICSVVSMSPDELSVIAGLARSKIIEYCSLENSISKLCKLLQ